MSNIEKSGSFLTKNFESTVSNEIDLREIVGTILQGKWLVLSCMMISLFLAMIFISLKTPQYQADILLQVQEKQGGLGGNLTQDIARFIGAGNPNVGISPIEMQKALITSRFILQPVIQQLRLDIKVEPHYLPVLNKFFADRNADSLKAPFLKLNRYAWGGEQLTVSELQMPPDYERKSIRLKLIAGNAGEYQLYMPDGKFLLKGRVGQLEKIILAGSDLPIIIRVEKLVANSGTEFFIAKSSLSMIANQLAQNLSVNDFSTRKAFANNTGIFKVTATSSKPAEAVDILNAIARIAVETDIAQKSEEIGKMYEFLKKQLPVTKLDLEAAENKLEQYKTKMGIKNIDPNDPIVMSLSRDIEAKSQLYKLILTKLEELRIVKAGIVSGTRILAFAQFPDKPISSQSTSIMFASLLIGLALGFSIVLLLKSFRQRVEDPYWLEKNMDIPTLSIIPHSITQDKNARAFKKGISSEIEILAEKFPHDTAIESLRSLRTSLQFILPKASNNIITVMGGSAEIGKSFVSVNLAYSLAETKRVLLIDADLRKGHLHYYFKQKNTVGLSSILNDSVAAADAIVKTQQPNLDFLPNGKNPSNPAELLMKEEFKKFLDEMSKQYELVVIDTPPILVATDSTLIATHGGVNLLVLGAGKHSIQSLEVALKQLRSSGVTIQGAIYNNTQRSHSHNYNNYYYNYSYIAENKN